MEVEIKRLFGEDVKSGFEGNKFEQSDIDSIINDLLDTHDYDTGDLTQKDITIDLKNGYKLKMRKVLTAGGYDQVTIYRTLRTKQTPLFSKDGNVTYQDDFLITKNVFYNDTDYLVKKPDRNVLDKSLYTIGVGGKITFSAAQTFGYLLLENIRYEEVTTIDIVRNAIGQIVSFKTVQS